MGGSSSSPESLPEDPAASVPAALKLYMLALHTGDGEVLDKVWHPRGRLLGQEDGVATSHDAAAFREMVMKRAPSNTEEYTRYDKVLQVSVLSSSVAAAKVNVAIPPGPSNPSGPTLLFTDWLVLIREPGVASWQIISKIYSSVTLPAQATSGVTEPLDFAGVAAAAWDFYRAAGRSGDGKKMGSVFHPVSLLTFITADVGLNIIDSDAFCETVEKWWEMGEMHKPYAHLRGEARVGSADALIGIDFAGPDKAMVTLRIGIPPMLYMDYLSFIRLSKPVPGRGDSGWWIVAKSSHAEPTFLVDEAKSHEATAHETKP